MFEPVRRPDGLCLECEGPLVDPASRQGGGNNVMHQDAVAWLGSLEKDPFCSTNCAKVFFGVLERRKHQSAKCVDCGKPPSVNGRKRGTARCGPCAKRHRRTLRLSNEPGCCVGCGVALAEYTKGCARCSNRRQRRDLIGRDPDFLRRERERIARYAMQKRLAAAGLTAGSIEPPENGSPHGGGDSPPSSERSAAA